MAKFTYKGPASGVTLKGVGEVLLWPGRDVELPEAHPYVRRLVARRLLVLALPKPTGPTEPAATPKKRPRASSSPEPLAEAGEQKP